MIECSLQVTRWQSATRSPRGRECTTLRHQAGKRSATATLLAASPSSDHLLRVRRWQREVRRQLHRTLLELILPELKQFCPTSRLIVMRPRCPVVQGSGPNRLVPAQARRSRPRSRNVLHSTPHHSESPSFRRRIRRQVSQLDPTHPVPLLRAPQRPRQAHPVPPRPAQRVQHPVRRGPDGRQRHTCKVPRPNPAGPGRVKRGWELIACV